MVKVFVTYGYGSNLRNCYSVVEAETERAARDEIFRVTDGRYAFTYTNEVDFQWQINECGLREVPLQAQVMEE